jgi:autotransporter-associated beta strand protein
MRFVAKPTGADGVLPTDRAVLGYGIGTIGTGASSRATFLTYDLGVDPNDVSDDPGLRPLAWDSEHATSIAAGGNVRLGAGDAVLPLAADASIRSLSLTDGSLQLDGSQLVIDSGLIMQGAAAGTGIGGNGSLSFPGEAPILTLGKVTRTIDVPIQAASLVKGGDGTLALTRANTFPLGVHIAEGTLAIRAPAALGSATVSSSGATLRIEAVSQTIQHLRGLGSFRISNSLGNFAFGATAGTLNVEAGRTLTIHNIEGGGGYFVVAGDGTVHIPADEQSQADLVVTGGELRLDGEVAMGGNVSVLDGRLSGTGTIAGTITGDGPAGSVISPGPGPARLTAWQLSLSHLLELELNGVQAGTLYDQLRVIERVSIAGGLDLDLSVGYAAQLGDSFTIIDNLSSQPPLNPFTGPAEGALFTANGYQLRLSYLGGDGNDVTLTVVPEPGLAGMGLLLGVLALRRRGHWRCPMSRRSAPRR